MDNLYEIGDYVFRKNDIKMFIVEDKDAGDAAMPAYSIIISRIIEDTNGLFYTLGGFFDSWYKEKDLIRADKKIIKVFIEEIKKNIKKKNYNFKSLKRGIRQHYELVIVANKEKQTNGSN